MDNIKKFESEKTGEESSANKIEELMKSPAVPGDIKARLGKMIDSAYDKLSMPSYEEKVRRIEQTNQFTDFFKNSIFYTINEDYRTYLSRKDEDSEGQNGWGEIPEIKEFGNIIEQITDPQEQTFFTGGEISDGENHQIIQELLEKTQKGLTPFMPCLDLSKNLRVKFWGSAKRINLMVDGENNKTYTNIIELKEGKIIQAEGWKESGNQKEFSNTEEMFLRKITWKQIVGHLKTHQPPTGDQPITPSQMFDRLIYNERIKFFIDDDFLDDFF